MFEVMFLLLPLHCRQLTFLFFMITATTIHMAPKTTLIDTIIDTIMVILLSVFLEFEINVSLALEKNVASVVSMAINASVEPL